GPDRWAELSAAVVAGAPGVAAVVDAGYTEVAPGSLTVIAADAGPS
ncbi:MAG TPA: peptidyl-tRNA hydrolase, partial [Actinomycetales bacterium]|nr:peptidyl-tRNA hydrolase [Actinomycetales bacterium]